MLSVCVLGACRKTGKGEYEVDKPVVGTEKDTVRTPTIEVGKDTHTVVTPTVQVGKDTSKVVTPKVRVKSP
jgi:hypothetical protein